MSTWQLPLEQRTLDNQHEPRSFVIGPLPPDEHRFISERHRENLAKVQVGTRYEDGQKIDIKTSLVVDRVDLLIQEIAAYAERHLRNGGVTRTQVEASLGRVMQSEKSPRLDEPVTPELINELYGAMIDRVMFEVRISLEELLLNHVEHGNKDPHKHFGGLYCIDETGTFRLESWDCGEGFDPDEVPSPIEAMALELPFGRGLLLEKQYMDTVDYQSGGPQGNLGTSVVMTKALSRFDERMLPADEDDEDSVEELAIDRLVKRGVATMVTERRSAEIKKTEKQEKDRLLATLEQSAFKWRLRLAKLLSGEWSLREAIAGRRLSKPS